MKLQDIVNEVAAHRGDIGIGQVSHRLRQLEPSELGTVQGMLDFVDEERDLGRWGTKDPFASLGIEPEGRAVAERIYSARRDDYLAEGVISRMGGSDAQVLPVPELTRADHISAALDLHSGD